MLKVISLFFALLSGPAFAAGGMMPDIVFAAPNGGACSQATAFIARESGSQTNNAAITTMICGMVTDGTWSLLDGLYIFATDSTGNAALNLVSSSFPATVHNTVTFTAGHGWAGNGSNGYLDTAFNPSSAAGNFARNSSSIGAYILTSRSTNQNTLDMGVGDGSSFVYMAPKANPASVFQWLLSSANTNQYVAANVQGSWMASRTSSTLTTFYMNGSSVASNASDTSLALPNFNLVIFGLNTSGSVSLNNNDQMSAVWWGAGFSSGQVSSIQSRINAYMTTLGINVY